MLKLFRDYLFHQVDPNGAPWIDVSHIVQCLNKVYNKRYIHGDHIRIKLFGIVVLLICPPL